MVIRQRAIQAEDKQERHHAILDAAERLLLRSPERVANVAEVADEAGLAKGTVYLYFRSKEALLLALHERNVDAFFAALIALCERPERLQVADILAITHAHMVDAPLFLPLATRCFAQIGQGAEPEAAAAFRQRMTDRLSRAGAALERHFMRLPPGGGVLLLWHSYALILGLRQMANVCAVESSPGGADGGTPHAVFGWSYTQEIDRALLALWRGTVGVDEAGGPR
jgi:AcrR family transcriptional regulator